MKRLFAWVLVSMTFFFAVPPARSGDWRVGGGLAPYDWGFENNDGWNAAWTFSGNTDYKIKRHLRAYGRLAYSFRSPSDGSDLKFHQFAAVMGMETIFRPFYLGLGAGFMDQTQIGQIVYVSPQVFSVQEFQGPENSGFGYELVFGLEIGVGRGAALRIDLLRMQESPGFIGQNQTVALMFKL